MRKKHSTRYRNMSYLGNSQVVIVFWCFLFFRFFATCGSFKFLVLNFRTDSHTSLTNICYSTLLKFKRKIIMTNIPLRLKFISNKLAEVHCSASTPNRKRHKAFASLLAEVTMLHAEVLESSSRGEISSEFTSQILTFITNVLKLFKH